MWTRFRTWFAELTRVYNGTAEFAELTRVYNQNTLPQGLPVSVQDDLVLTAHRRGGSIFVRFFGQIGSATMDLPFRLKVALGSTTTVTIWLKIRANGGSKSTPVDVAQNSYECWLGSATLH